MVLRFAVWLAAAVAEHAQAALVFGQVARQQVARVAVLLAAAAEHAQAALVFGQVSGQQAARVAVSVAPKHCVVPDVFQVDQRIVQFVEVRARYEPVEPFSRLPDSQREHLLLDGVVPD